MKEFLSLFVFGIGALCFVVFFTTVKPAAIIPAVGPITLGPASRSFMRSLGSGAYQKSVPEAPALSNKLERGPLGVPPGPSAYGVQLLQTFFL